MPIYNSHAYILNSEGEPVRNPGEVGQLFVSSPNLALGYCGGDTQSRGYVASKVGKIHLNEYIRQILVDPPVRHK